MYQKGSQRQAWMGMLLLLLLLLTKAFAPLLGCSILFHLAPVNIEFSTCQNPVYYCCSGSSAASVKHRSQVYVGQRSGTKNLSLSILSPTSKIQIIYQWLQTPFIDAILHDLSSINCCLVANHLGRSRAVFLKNIAGARRTSHKDVDNSDQ